MIYQRTLFVAAVLTTALPAQGLRHAVAGANVVVVATGTGVRPLGKHWILHRLRVVTALKGTVPDAITAVELKTASHHVRPKPGAQRLYCLHDFSEGAKRAKLPQSRGPFYRMNGHAGSHVLVKDHQTDPAVALARTILASEAGASPVVTASALVHLALHGNAMVRTEAVQALTERPILRATLGTIDRSSLLSRAVGETDDIPFKIALAQMCAEERMPNLVDSLCISNDAVADPRFASALGRIARVLHGEKSVDVLRPHILQSNRRASRGRLLLALGSTETEGALEALLRMRQIGGPDRYVDAALRAHGSARAAEAVVQRSGPGKPKPVNGSRRTVPVQREKR